MNMNRTSHLDDKLNGVLVAAVVAIVFAMGTVAMGNDLRAIDDTSTQIAAQTPAAPAAVTSAEVTTLALAPTH